MTLKELRVEHGLTEAHVARAIGTSQARISCWENGKGFPSIKNINRLAEVYGIDTATVVRAAMSGKKHKAQTKRQKDVS